MLPAPCHPCAAAAAAPSVRLLLLLHPPVRLWRYSSAWELYSGRYCSSTSSKPCRSRGAAARVSACTASGGGGRYTVTGPRTAQVRSSAVWTAARPDQAGAVLEGGRGASAAGWRTSVAAAWAVASCWPWCVLLSSGRCSLLLKGLRGTWESTCGREGRRGEPHGSGPHAPRCVARAGPSGCGSPASDVYWSDDTSAYIPKPRL